MYIYEPFVWPVLEFGSIIWGALNKRKYRGSTKLIHGLYDTSYHDCFVTQS